MHRPQFSALAYFGGIGSKDARQGLLCAELCEHGPAHRQGGCQTTPVMALPAHRASKRLLPVVPGTTGRAIFCTEFHEEMQFWPELPPLLIHGIQGSNSRMESQCIVKQGQGLGLQRSTEVSIAIGKVPHANPGTIGFSAQWRFPHIDHSQAEWNQSSDLCTSSREFYAPFLRSHHSLGEVMQAISGALSLSRESKLSSGLHVLIASLRALLRGFKVKSQI